MNRRSRQMPKVPTASQHLKRDANSLCRHLAMLESEFYTTSNALCVWEAIDEIYLQRPHSPEEADYPEWIKDYLAKAARRLLRPDDNYGSLTETLKASFQIHQKAAITRHINQASDIRIYRRVLDAKSQPNCSTWEQAYSMVAKAQGIKASAVKRVFLAARKKFSGGKKARGK